jgi:uncharacterized SAM-binding protein YcdF (DUF218 family)
MWRVYDYAKLYHEDASDVAIVLGAGTSNGKLSPVFEERMNHAIYLMKNQKVKFIIITGGFGDGQNISDSYAAKSFAVQKGIPEANIFIEESSQITYENIINAQKIMEQNEFQTALLVSDPYHMKRAMAMCQDLGINALSSPTPTTMYRSAKAKRDFLINQTWNYCVYILFKRYR